MKNLGARIYGLAAIHLGILGLLWGEFTAGWFSVPTTLPGRTTLAYVVAVLFIAGGVLINWHRTARFGAAILTVLFTAGLVLLDLTRLAAHLGEFDYWDGSAEQVALVAGGLIAYATRANIPPALSLRVQQASRAAFGLCLFFFGAAHFVYLDHTVSMVPKWIPPGPVFWAWFTALAAIAAGLSLVSGVLALQAARLLSAMYVIFGLVVHVPILMAHPDKHWNWEENALNLALLGAAWVIADSLAGKSATEPS